MNTSQTECGKETAIRHEMALATYAGDYRRVNELTYELTDHRRTCPVCNETIASQLFKGAKVVVK